MPELPDVEGERRLFRRRATGRTVAAVRADDDILRNTSAQGLGRALKGRRLGRPDRAGKWLLCPADGPFLVLHFGMTGRLVWSDGDEGPHPHDRMVLELDHGELRYRSQRKLGGVWLLKAGEGLEDVTGSLGADASSVGRDELGRMLARRRGGIKGALMDQSFIAGLGNLTVDESLWRTGIDPRTPASSLSEDDVARLHRAIRGVLRGAIPEGRVPPKRSWLTGVRDRRDAACPRCGQRLRRATIAGRTTVSCPRCQ